MLKPKEFADLKVQAIFDEIQSKTGMSLEELHEADQASAKAAVSRLKEKCISLPEPKPSPEIKLKRARTVSRDYEGRRNHRGKGVLDDEYSVLLNIFTSVAIESDDKLWFHAAITRADGIMPTYNDLIWLKQNFFADTWAIQVFPTADQHISHHGKCLHLWTCLEEFEMPDFRKFGATI